MPLIRNIEDPRVVTQIDGLSRRSQFIREIASAILTFGIIAWHRWLCALPRTFTTAIARRRQDDRIGSGLTVRG